MPRPALSASRSLDIFDLLAAFPHRDFTLTEIATATKVNVASCHAVLNALVERGYLSRVDSTRSYRLGSVPIAIGQAAQIGQPLIARAMEAAHQLHRTIGVPTLLTGRLGDEIIGLVSLRDAAGHDAGMRVAERRPLVAPLGAPLVAWDSDAVIDTWIAGNALPRSEERVSDWRHILELTRKRGYQVSLRSPDGPNIGAMLAELSAGRSATDYRHGVHQLFNALEHQLDQPEDIADDSTYDIALIGAPVFDRTGKAVLSLGLGGFVEQLTGATIKQFADRLVRTCLEIMRADRAAP